MPSDRSRAPDRTRHGYTGVVAQQGRVVLDRDFNAQQGLTADRIAADALDFVGPVGTPDDGFAISLPDALGSTPTYWSPPVASSPPQTPGEAGDFLVSPGTMYIGGQRVCFPSRQGDKTVTYSYVRQPDWPSPDRPPSPPPSAELVYLAVAEQEVSAVEDPDLFEVALGGPDTTQRLKLLSRIERRTAASTNCAQAWQEAVDAWAQDGWTFDPTTMQLRPSARLKIGFTDPGADGDPCDPQASGGYLGADNQLLRIRIDRKGVEASVLWGFDDASFIYRIAQVSNRNTLTLAADPPDPNHFPMTGQWVEILTTASVLGVEPDELDLLDQAGIQRVVAQAQGTVRQLAQPYGPLPGSTTNVIVLSDALPADVAESPLPLFLRVWQGRQKIGAHGGTVTLETTTTNSTTGQSTTVSTGVTATLSGGPLANGVYWEVAVRPSTPQGVYPEDLLTAPQPPVGPRLWACPLAVIDWRNFKVTDCRSKFEGLVALTRRRPGCCTVSIAPRDITEATSLQALIDRAVLLADAVTVCLQTGLYTLPGTLYLDDRHAGLTLEGCGGPVTLTYEWLDDYTPFLDGVIAIHEAQDITLQGLTIRPPVVPSSEAFHTRLLDRLNNDGFPGAERFFQRPDTSFGVRAFGSAKLTIKSCEFVLAQTRERYAQVETQARRIAVADLFAAAISLQGDCPGARIENCRAVSAIAPTCTPLRVNANDAAPNRLKVFNDLLTRHLAEPFTAENFQFDMPIGSPPAGSPPAAAPAPASAPAAPPRSASQAAPLETLMDEHAIIPIGTASPPAAPAPVQEPAPPAPARAEQLNLAERAAPPVEPVAAHLASPPLELAAEKLDLAMHAAAQPDATAAASPPSSPPSEYELLDRRVSSSLDFVMARRFAIDLLEPLYAVVTVGILAASSLDGATALGESMVTGCRLEGFTFATWFSAEMSILRLQENTVAGGVAGLWLEVVDAGPPLRPAQDTEGYYQSTILFEEYQLLVSLAASFPPPRPPRKVRPLIARKPPKTGVDISMGVEEPMRYPPYSLVVSGNQVDVRPQTQSQGASAAMMLALYRDAPIQPLTSIIVQSNRLCGGTASLFAQKVDVLRTAAPVPAALITLPPDTCCAVNGNVVINGSWSGRDSNAIAPSLWLTIAESGKGATELAVTGNVLRGRSDLMNIQRLGLDATWSIHNANPS